MASTRAQQAQLIENPPFLDQLAGCLIAAAVQGNERGSKLSESHESPRICERDPGESCAAGVFHGTRRTNELDHQRRGGQPETIPDSDMDFVVAGLLDIYANQYVAQQNSGAPFQVGN